MYYLFYMDNPFAYNFIVNPLSCFRCLEFRSLGGLEK